MFNKLIPLKIQWKKWSLLRKLITIGTLLGLLVLVYLIIIGAIFFSQNHNSKITDEQKARSLLFFAYSDRTISLDKLNEYFEKLDSQNNKIEFIQGLHFVDSTIFQIDKQTLNYNYLMKKEIKTGGAENGLTLTNPDFNKIKVKVKNCKEYFHYKKKRYYALSTYDMKDQTFFSETCDAIMFLQRMKPSNKSFIKGTSIHDLNTWPASLFLFTLQGDVHYSKYTKKYKTIDDMIQDNFLKIKKTTKNSIIWESSSMGQYLSELIRGDFNNDGYEDILILNYIYSTEGTLGFGFTQVWTKKDKKKLFKLIQDF